MADENQIHLNEQVKKSSIYILCGKLFTPIITFLVTIYIVRKLSIDDYGVYNILLAMMAFIGLASSFGLPNIIKRYLPEFLQNGEITNLKRTVLYSLFLRFTLTSLLLCVVFLFSDEMGPLFKIEGYFFLFKIFSLGILFHLESQLIGVILTSIFLHKYFVISQMVYTLVRGGLLYILLASGWPLKGLIIGEVIAFGFLLLTQAGFYLIQYHAVHHETKKTKFPYRRLLRFGGFCYFNEIGEQILDVSTDIIIISAFLGSQMVGLYAFANRVIRLISRWMPHRLLMDVITPTFYTRYAQTKDIDELSHMFNLILKLIAFVFIPAIMGIFILGKELVVYVFDPKYLSTLPIILIVAVFSLINSFAYPLGLVVESIEKVEIHLYSKLFSLYNIIGDLLVINRFGITGIALVTSSAILFKNIYVFLAVKKHIRLSIDFKSLGKILMNSVLMAIVVLLFRNRIENIYMFLFIVLLGGIVFFVISFFNKAFSVNERNMINNIIKVPIFRF